MHQSKILIVDDEPKITTSLGVFLSSGLKYPNIKTCHSGIEAQKILEKEYFDLIITDYNMPNMTGIQLIQNIRKQKIDSEIVMLTAGTNEKLLKECINLGIYKFIEKPFEFDIFKKMMTDFNEIQANKYKKNAAIDLGYNVSTITHEINNPLSVLLLRSHLLMQDIENNRENIDISKLFSQLQSIEIAAKKIHTLVKDVKLSQQGKEMLAKTDIALKSIETEILDYMVVYSQSKITFKVIYSNISENFNFSFNNDQLIQIIINLINNSADAISDQENPWIKLLFEQKGNNLLISVIDSGSGIEKEYHSKIFEKSFSKKKKQLGTGMGLFICKEILKNNNAEFFLDTNCSNTCFTIKI